jgi:hypothetical protein
MKCANCGHDMIPASAPLANWWECPRCHWQCRLEWAIAEAGKGE